MGAVSLAPACRLAAPLVNRPRGKYSLNAGESTWVSITFGYGDDAGATWIMAHPELDLGFAPEEGNRRLQVTQHPT